MKNPYVFTMIAVVLYGVMNVIQEQKFARFTPAVCLALYFSIMTPLFYTQWAFMRVTNQRVAVPGRSMLGYILLFGIAYFLADWSYLTAYAKGGTAFTITTIMIALPLVTATVDALWGKTLPSIQQLIGYVVTAVGIYLVTTGKTAG